MMLVALLCTGLVGGLALLALYVWWSLRHQRRMQQLEQEYLDAYRALHVTVGIRTEVTRFTYRPATHELTLDAEGARLHGLSAGEGSSNGFVTLDGWEDLPSAAGAAGWLDDAMADGLATRQPVECEYRARAAGQADRHFVLSAVPLRTADVLVGEVAQRGAPPGARLPAPGPAAPAPGPGPERDMRRAWLPGSAARGPSVPP